MIYILRHQEGQVYDNCLSPKGLKNTHKIAQWLIKLNENSVFFKTVYTVLPSDYSHIRPVQTASLLCTYMNEHNDKFSVKTCEDRTALVEDVSRACVLPWLDVIIVWHHGDMQALVRDITHDNSWKFKWPDDNYDGCLIVDVGKTAQFIADFFAKPVPYWSRFHWCTY